MEDFGMLSDGRKVRRVVLDNGRLRVGLLDLGALIQDVRMTGVDFPLTLGGSEATAYEAVMSHFGAVIGPVVNRISDAKATIDGRTYHFEANQDGRHTRHSGSAGTHRKIWDIADEGEDHVTFRLDLPDGEGGFPGNRTLGATYRLNGATLVVVLRGTTDAPTLMNLANHGYWCVNDGPDWSGQRLQILTDRYLPGRDDDLPTGEIAEVAGTRHDFREPRRLQRGETPKLDNNYCLSDAPRPLASALRLSGDAGVTLEIATTAPGIQVFDMGKFGAPGPTIHGHDNARYAALAYEPQMWPDAPGRADWPDIILRPGETFAQQTEYRFSRDV